MKIDRYERAAKVAHDANRAYCHAIGEEAYPTWELAPAWQQGTVRAGVRQIAENPSLTPEESHALWMERKLAEGWVYGPKKDPDRKQHPCIVSYDELSPEQKTKDCLFIACVHAVLFGDQPL